MNKIPIVLKLDRELHKRFKGWLFERGESMQGYLEACVMAVVDGPATEEEKVAVPKPVLTAVAPVVPPTTGRPVITRDKPMVAAYLK